MKLIFCDKIAHFAKEGLKKEFEVSGIKIDLHPELGYYVSTKKTMEITDHNGTKYTLTIEEKGE